MNKNFETPLKGQTYESWPQKEKRFKLKLYGIYFKKLNKNSRKLPRSLERDSIQVQEAFRTPNIQD
jgi:hypothetical protein